MLLSSQPNASGVKWIYLFIGISVLVNFSGLFVPLMDPDAGIYASISKNMLLQNDYLNLWFQEKDWLDKPHLPFWIVALFFKLFGIYEWSYKLPGVLFAMVGAWYTYLFAKQYYNKTVALWAVFILLTSGHFMISNSDVRAEPFLTGFIIASIYHFSNSLKKNIGWQLVAGCFFAACALMTKGMFTLFPIAGAVIGELIIKKNLKQLFHWRWLVALLLITLFIFPELYSLWYQIDSHPEKIIFGKTNVSGIWFFFWESQIGRFFNTGPIKSTGNPTFYLHTLLWAFFPWSIIMYVMFFDKVKALIKKIILSSAEWYMFSGSLITLIVFSFSGFQLPHYTNILFPMLAILCADFIWRNVQSEKKVFKTIHNTFTFLLLVIIIALSILYQPAINLSAIVLLLVFILACLFFVPSSTRQGDLPVHYFRSGLAALLVTLFLNLVFYPDLMSYQSGNQLALYMNKNHPDDSCKKIGIFMPSGEIYFKQKMLVTTLEEIKIMAPEKRGLLFVTEEELLQFKQQNIEFELLKELRHFPVTTLSFKFINKKTRENTLKKRFLIRMF